MHKHFGSTAVSRTVRVVSLLALGFAALGSPQPARALGIIIGVSTETDELTPNAVCSLREAVYVASNPGDTTYPECGTGVGNDSIETGPGPYILTMNQPLEPAADMRFYGDEEVGTIIEASDCDPTPASPGCTPADFPVFSITTPSITVSMQDLSIQYGYATGASGDGGGIHNENATLHLSLVQVIHNRAGGNGGGIYNDGGTVNLDSTGVGSNVADAGAGGESGGGGIFNNHYTASHSAASDYNRSNIIIYCRE